MKHVTLQKIVAHDFRYDPRISDYDKSSLADRALCDVRRRYVFHVCIKNYYISFESFTSWGQSRVERMRRENP